MMCVLNYYLFKIHGFNWKEISLFHYLLLAFYYFLQGISIFSNDILLPANYDIVVLFVIQFLIMRIAIGILFF